MLLIFIFVVVKTYFITERHNWLLPYIALEVIKYKAGKQFTFHDDAKSYLLSFLNCLFYYTNSIHPHLGRYFFGVHVRLIEVSA